jgi:site-specific DNA-methyltransferase (adenine-specific)
LDKFRSKLLNDNRLRVLHDYFDSTDCFPGVDISGGICYFLWDRDNSGLCNVFSHLQSKVTESERPLIEGDIDTFIRFNEGISVLNKVNSKNEEHFDNLVSPRDPFGLNYYENGKEVMFKKYESSCFDNSAKMYYYGWQKGGIGYANRKYINTKQDIVDKYKVYISKAYGERGGFPYLFLGKPFIGEPGTICNMTYLVTGHFDDKQYAENCISYIQTRFFRFLVGLLKNTQNAYKKVYAFVPVQDFSEPWTDEKLYKKYSLTDAEITFIESMIRPMELGGENDND